MEVLELKTNLAELAFRREYFNEEDPNFPEQISSHLKCSVCETKISWMIFFKKQIFYHTFLKVLLCEGCFLWLNEPKNWNRSCLLCGFIRNEDSNRYCTNCPAIFCQVCIKRNFGLSESIKARFDPAWKCVKCNPESFWFARGICDFTVKFVSRQNALSCLENSQMKKGATCTKCNVCEVRFESVSILQCKHKFHADCIKQWLNKSKTCPLCRVPSDV